MVLAAKLQLWCVRACVHCSFKLAFLLIDNIIFARFADSDARSSSWMLWSAENHLASSSSSSESGSESTSWNDELWMDNTRAVDEARLNSSKNNGSLEGTSVGSLVVTANAQADFQGLLANQVSRTPASAVWCAQIRSKL